MVKQKVPPLPTAHGCQAQPKVLAGAPIPNMLRETVRTRAARKNRDLKIRDPNGRPDPRPTDRRPTRRQRRGRPGRAADRRAPIPEGLLLREPECRERLPALEG